MFMLVLMKQRMLEEIFPRDEDEIVLDEYRDVLILGEKIMYHT
jgi:hypothetical protein